MSIALVGTQRRSCCESSPLLPSEQDLLRVFHAKYGDRSRMGWGPRARLAYHYFTPDDHYEALMDKLIGEETRWLDVGCGRDIFSSNAALARELSNRCRCLVGVDPDDNIDENPYVHEKHKGTIETYVSPEAFDVVSLRMVAEHFPDPWQSVAALARLTRIGGVVVVYTVHKWSPIPLATRVVPASVRDVLKRKMWNAMERDTFPVSYQLNTPGRLKRVFEGVGFREVGYSSLDDCRTLSNYRLGLCAELAFRRFLAVVGCRYPERCLLGVYERAC